VIVKEEKCKEKEQGMINNAEEIKKRRKNTGELI
jgi:hypothetical protein